MSIEGRLTIDLSSCRDGTGQQARIVSSRPLGLARVFVGRSADETVRTLPLMFNICGVAQGAAAAQACERALGIEVDGETQAVRSLLVTFEALREHLLRTVIDWSRFLGLDAEADDTLSVMRLYAAAKRALDPGAQAFAIGAKVDIDEPAARALVADAARLVEMLVVAEPLETWRRRTKVSELESWAAEGDTAACRLVHKVLQRGWADAGQADVRFLPDLAEPELTEQLFGVDAETFIAAPTWEGAPHETSALARQGASPLVADVRRAYGSALLARLAARLVEIAELPQMMVETIEVAKSTPAQEPKEPGCDGRGFGQIEAARGRLVHGVELAGKMVSRYAILAPTEWNFHTAGAAAQGLAGIAARGEDAHQIADLFVTSIDPCVAYEVRVN